MNKQLPVIDMHTHILPVPEMPRELALGTEGRIHEELRGLVQRLQGWGVSAAHTFLLDEHGMQSLGEIPPELTLSLMLDFRSPAAAERAQEAKRRGIKGIKVLTYEQEVTAHDHGAVLSLAREVERQGMFLTVCSTFGSKKLFSHDAIALCSHLAAHGCQAPLIMAHAGGSRVREALLLMDDCPNIFADTSFTTTYWRESLVIDELAYLIRRFPERCFFGSDIPYVDFAQALADAQALLAKLPQELHRGLLHDNGRRFLEQYAG